MKYSRFEDLPCWQKAREFGQEVYKTIGSGAFAKDYGLKDQMWRASGSVMDNIAEGFDDMSTKEFIRFLGYSHRSCSEVQSQLYRALDCKYISEAQFKKIYEIAKVIKKGPGDHFPVRTVLGFI